MTERSISATTPGIVRMLKALEEFGPLTQSELSAIAIIGQRTLNQSYIPKARELKLIHIGRQERNKCGPPVRYYALGDFPDAPKPRKLTTKQKCKRWRGKHGDEYNEYRRTKRRLEKPSDPILAVFMGVAPLGAKVNRATG